MLPVVLALVSAGIADRYVSRMTQDGTLYFIEPKKLGVRENLHTFEYDMTLLTWSDSATVNFTFVSKNMELPAGFAIKNADYDYECTSYSPLYIDIVKKGYEVRITSKFPVAQIEKIIESPAPPVFTFTQGGAAESASYTQGAWNKDRLKLQNILSLYKYTK